MINQIRTGQSADSRITDNASESNMSISCEHYPKKRCSKLFFACCQVFDPCHWCHLARGCRQRPAQVAHIECIECGIQQTPSNQCVSCGIQFGRIHCDICKLWTEVDVFHCDSCLMCRVGKRDQTYHCARCDCCWSADNRETHHCVGVSWKELSCPFCLESMHYSRVAGQVLNCDHVVHSPCVESALRKGQYRCPLCRKSMCNMTSYWNALRHSINAQPITAEIFPVRVGDTVDSDQGDFYVERICEDGICDGLFPNNLDKQGHPIAGSIPRAELRRKTATNIYCYECSKRSTAPFHFLGLECGDCGSFNTVRI